MNRQQLSERFIPAGNGLEIGALHARVELLSHSCVTYIDRLSLPQLREHYPELEHSGFVTPDIVDDGEMLTSIDDNSQNFVIANHFVEHTEDPFTCLKNFSRVLKPKGILFLTVPDMQFTFDRKRPLTSIEHLERDYRFGSEVSRWQHYLEWAELVDNKKAECIEPWAEKLQKSRYSIHFHTWTFKSFKKFLNHAIERYTPDLNIKHLEQLEIEGVFVLEKLTAVNR